MNRKEGTIVGIVMLATFITGVFAVPEQQILNVFVTNFPQNQSETRVVFSENLVLAGNTTLQRTFIPIEVSQFRHARVLVEVLSPHLPGSPSAPIVVSQVQVASAFPVSPPGTYSIGEIVTSTGAAATCEQGLCVAHSMVDGIDVDTPYLLVSFNLYASSNIECTARVVAFLQR